VRLARRGVSRTPARYAAAALAVVLGATVLLTLGLAPAAQKRSPSPRAVELTCPAPALDGTLRARAYLPAGYAKSRRRYPVIYFLHGLPTGPQAYTGNGFVAAAIAGGLRQAIVVTPQGARAPDSDDEYLNQGPGEDWPATIAVDLPRCVDTRFRTIASRDARALLGLSAGGYGAVNIGLRYLGTFAAVESWSGYFEATDPSGRHILNLGSRPANAAARAPRDAELRAQLVHRPTFIGFYVGNQDQFLPDNLAYDAALRQQHIRHTFAVYPGGHTDQLWSREAHRWLGYALDWLAALRSGAAPHGSGPRSGTRS
jgi:enterochelin esterase-like enzyme